MMRDSSTNRLHQGNAKEKEEQEPVLRSPGSHTTDLYRPPTPSESTPPPPPYVIREDNELNDLSTLSDRPTVLPQDHDHPS